LLREIDFSFKKFAGGFKSFAFVETNYLNTVMCKFETSQKDESGAQSAYVSKA